MVRFHPCARRWVSRGVSPADGHPPVTWRVGHPPNSSPGNGPQRDGYRSTRRAPPRPLGSTAERRYHKPETIVRLGQGAPGCSSARAERLFGGQEVAGSSPASLTTRPWCNRKTHWSEMPGAQRPLRVRGPPAAPAARRRGGTVNTPGAERHSRPLHLALEGRLRMVILDPAPQGLPGSNPGRLHRSLPAQVDAMVDTPVSEAGGP